jgi:uncharacterized protein (UPF0548 family)
MWFVRRPGEERVQTFRLEQARLPYSYPGVGGSRTSIAPPGYTVDRHRVRLGSGPAVFDAACAALRGWRHFPPAWTAIHPATTPLEGGRTVALLVRAFGLWWLNSARVVYALDEATPVRRFGFAYGTLPGHAERGEERFSVEHHGDDSVWYELWAFSRPGYWVARLAYPLTQWTQERFAQDSMAAMREACREAAG